MPRADVEEIFSRFNNTGLVQIHITTEPYTRPAPDTRTLIKLLPGQSLVAHIQTDSNNKIVRKGYRIIDEQGNEIEFIPDNDRYDNSYMALASLQSQIRNKFNIVTEL